MKNKILYIAFLLLALGCKKQQQSDRFDTMYNPVSLKESVMSIPDSVATSEQLALKRKIEDISFFKTQVKDNRFKLSVGKDYFISNDIPIRYYDLINESIKETNIGIAKMEAEGINIDLVTKFQESKKAYKAYIEAFGKSAISLDESPQ